MDKLILILVISFAVWIFNLLNQNKAKGRVDAGPGRPAGPPRDRRVQNEIDDFLKEIGGGRKIENARDDDIFIEIVPDDERADAQKQRRVRRALSQQRSLQPQPVPETPAAQPPVHKQLGSGIAERKGPGLTGLGGGVSQHVSEHMRTGMVVEHVQQHLGHDFNQIVKEHLGTSSRDLKTPLRVDSLLDITHEIVKLLHNPSGMRQAILLSEVLSPPKGLRRSS
jgi:hypothetical protein